MADRRYAAEMSGVVFGIVVLFAIYGMAHFLHEWMDSRRDRDSPHSE